MIAQSSAIHRQVSNSAGYYEAYRRAQVETATAGELVLLLYSGLLRFLGQARSALDRRDRDTAHNALLRAQAILCELMAGIDMEKGELARLLLGLYAYLYRRLIEANCHQDLSALEEVQAAVSALHETWRQVVEGGTQ